MEVWYQHQCCDLNMLTQHHQFCTVVEYIWLTIGSSYTNTHTHMQIGISLLPYTVEIN